jgi:ABC-2 type transport system permease protein
MKKIWLIAVNLYKRQIRSGSFLLITLGMPLLMVAAGAIPILLEERAELPKRVGLVDQTGQLQSPAQVSLDSPIEIQSYPNPEAALNAYEQDEIASYLVVPTDYTEGATVTVYAPSEPSAALEHVWANYLRRAQIGQAPDWVDQRLENPTKLTFVSQATGEEIAEGPGLFVRLLFPAVLGLLFAFAVLLGVNQMGSAMVREKDQRALEMIITSVRPGALVAGKVIGISLLSLTQGAIWAVGAAIAALLALSGTLTLADLSIPWNALLWAVLLGIPGYFLYATVAIGLGIIAGDSQQARQLAGMLTFVGMTPLYLTGVLVNAPNGPLAVGFTLFPLTAPVFGLLRMALTEVPVWQLATSFGLILASLLLAIWVVARIFRAAMLMYGQALSLKGVWRALRQA